MKTIYFAAKIRLIILLLAVTGIAAAQEDINRELTLEREYDPSVQDANKVNTLPAVKEPVVNKLPIDYSTFTVPTQPQRELGILPSGNVMTDIDYNKRRGYLNFGIGSYMNINGDIGYHILSTDIDQLNIFFSHRSTNGNLKYNHGEGDSIKTKAKLNDNLGGINFRHQFEHAALKLGAKYGYTSFNYYGQPNPNTSYTLRSDEYQVLEPDNQTNQLIQVNAGVESKADAAVGYWLDLGYTNFSYKYGLTKDIDGLTENAIGGKLGMSAGFNGNQRVGVGGSFNYFNYSFPSESEDDFLNFDNYFEGTVNPYYMIDGDNWHLKLGANVMFITGDNSKFFVSPDVAADITVGSKTVLYLKAGGEIGSNSMYQLSRTNRYINPMFGADPSRTWLDAVVGLRCGVAPGFWFNVFGGYKITDDDAFFIPDFYSDAFANNVSSPLSIDSKRLQGGVEMKYAYQKFFEIRLKGVYNNWDLEDPEASSALSEYKAYGRPEAEFNAGITVRPIEDLSLGLDYNLATGRKTCLYTHELWSSSTVGDYENVKMKNISDLNVTATYAINDTFGAYAKVNNLLFQKYELQYGYPMQRCNFMVGVNINF